MIELPEAVTIARQLDADLRGKRIVAADTGSRPHKWVFYSPNRKELEKRATGSVIVRATGVGRAVHVRLGKDVTLFVDDFGGRILYHDSGKSLPKKYHLALTFADDSFLTIAIQGWGFIAVATEEELREHARKRAQGFSPIDDQFTIEHFRASFDRYEKKAKDSIKTFFTNGRSVSGIGNGYLQDILFRAGIDPRRKVESITPEEQHELYRAVKETIDQAILLNGRECEFDLYGERGNYSPVMDRSAKDKPCPSCGNPIQKISYLGGSCYLCPTCQR
jgi:formamidopyrimidine-DNA glycosylase